MTKRIRGVSGGTSASKTISILLWLIDYAQHIENKTISVVSESMPHLRRGALRDFLDIMTTHRFFKDTQMDKTNSIYRFDNGSIIEFFGADSWEKIKGARRDILFINEANHISFETYNQLEVRTRELIWLDWNPESEFWWYTEVIPHQDVDSMVLTYRDNEALEQSIVDSIESRQYNKNWWKVYGLGELGATEARIYTNWEIIEEVPIESQLIRYGLDFGYSNDPTASDALYRWNGAIVIDEIVDQKGLSNRQIADIFINLPRALIIADGSEPKSIAELASYGLRIMAAQKGAGSVNQGIQYVQGQKVFITKRSVNTLKEYRNYLWLTDKEGKIINEPSPIWNHHMDDIRYGMESLRAIPPRPTTQGFGGIRSLYPELGIA